MRFRSLLVGGAVLSCLLLPTVPALAAPVQIDMTGAFNADVIVNGTVNHPPDSTQSALDNVSYSLGTQKAMDASCGFSDPKGLPNTGLFPATNTHPLVQLAYRNYKNGNNVHRSENPDSFTVAIPPAKYKKVHVFMTSGDDASQAKVTFKYRGGTTSAKSFTVNDWFDAATGAGAYSLIGGMDRMTPTGGSCDESNNGLSAHIFGQKLTVDSSKTLKSMIIAKTNFEPTVLNTFGAIAIKP